jgi:hypothetical protein
MGLVHGVSYKQHEFKTKLDWIDVYFSVKSNKLGNSLFVFCRSGNVSVSCLSAKTRKKITHF